MLDWSRSELRTLAVWHFAHAWALDEGDWVIEITPDSIRCNRPSLENPEAEQIGREMMLQTWGYASRPLRGRIVVKRGADDYYPE